MRFQIIHVLAEILGLSDPLKNPQYALATYSVAYKHIPEKFLSSDGFRTKTFIESKQIFHLFHPRIGHGTTKAILGCDISTIGIMLQMEMYVLFPGQYGFWAQAYPRKLEKMLKIEKHVLPDGRYCQLISWPPFGLVHNGPRRHLPPYFSALLYVPGSYTDSAIYVLGPSPSGGTTLRSVTDKINKVVLLMMLFHGVCDPG